jgi:hypothetical protein
MKTQTEKKDDLVNFAHGTVRGLQILGKATVWIVIGLIALPIIWVLGCLWLGY